MKGQDLIDKLTRQIDAAAASDAAPTNGHARPVPARAPGPVPDEAIIEECRTASNAAKFKALFDRGDTSSHGGDDSAADYALLGILKFNTQDPDQLERLMRASALARSKWDEGRAGKTWLRYSIENALKDVGETRKRPKERARSLSSSPTSLGVSGDDDNNDGPEVVWFHELGEPKPRRFIVEKIARKAYPLIVYGAGGVAKSFAALAGAVAIASKGEPDEWMGLKVLEHGTVLYMDFELDQDEQHNRVVEICKGLEVDVPKRLAYLSGRGFTRDAAFSRARRFCKENDAVAVLIDSVGQAAAGDMDKNRDVNAFYRENIEPFQAMGVTPILVDHQGKVQAGEKQKDKSPIGGVYKTNNARSVLQFVLDEYDKETATLDIRVQTYKTNNAPVEPFGIRIRFEPGKVSLTTRELPPEERMDEERASVKERILTALGLDDQTVDDLERLTGASYGTIRNKLSELAAPPDPTVGDKGYRGRKKLYGLLSSSPNPPRGSDSDDNKPQTVEELFANPPLWLANQIEEYRKDPANRILALNTAVAATVLGDPMRGPDVAEDVEKELERWRG